MRNAAEKVTEVVIPGAGHWLMEETPTETIRAISGFIAHGGFVARPCLQGLPDATGQ